MNPPDHEDPRRVLARHGLAPKRSFSQNFLVSRESVEKIAAAAADVPNALVVELGPGAGTLTTALLRRGAEVIAVERDRDMIALLRAELGSLPSFHLVEGDAATFDFAGTSVRTGRKLRVAGNLPYAITGRILRNLIAAADVIEHAVVMIQKEVRDRLLAAPSDPDYGALTVFVQARMHVESVAIVRRGAFHPPPKVDSAVVKLVPREAPRAIETPAFRAVVRAAFAQRRKMLRNALRSIAPAEAVDVALESARVAPTARGETLDVETFASLARALESWLRQDSEDEGGIE